MCVVGRGGGEWHAGLLWSAENLGEISEETANPKARRNWPKNGEIPEKIMRASKDHAGGQLRNKLVTRSHRVGHD